MIKLGRKKVKFKSGSGKFFYGYPLIIEKYKGYRFYVITEKFKKTIIEASTGWYVCTLYCHYKDFESKIKEEFIDKISIKRMKEAISKARSEIKENDRT